MSITSSKNLKTLTITSLVMITVGSVDSIRNLPATALFGSSLIFFFLLGAVFFLIPTALVSAELASTYAKMGGVYVWVKRAFGTSAGFIAIWLQWIENVIWYPTILSFVAGTIGYLISPTLANNSYFLVAVILCAFWGATFVNWLGIKSSAQFATFCTIAGLIIPMVLIISLGIIWIVIGKPMAINLAPVNLIPNLHESDMWVALTGIILSFCGMEIATVHAGDVKDPQRSFPHAMLISTLIILVTLILGSLAIAIVLPTNTISLVAGLMEAFAAFFNAYHLHWILPVIAVLLVIGGLGSVSNWIIAPTRGLLVAAEDGQLPHFFQQVNKYNSPSRLLTAQAIIVTILCAIFLLMPSVNASYWLLTALAAQLYMFMYILMFAAAIYLRFKDKISHRPYSIPGGNFGILLVAGAGILGSVVTVIVGFFPPEGINVGSWDRYDALILAGLILMCLPPVISIFRQQFKRRALITFPDKP